MDFFQHRYYRLNKTLMTLIGQWPYQSIRTRCRVLAVYIFLIISHVVPQILALVKYHENPEIVLDCIMPLVGSALCVIKLINFIRNSQKTLNMLNRIRINWAVWRGDREINILHEYAEQGEKITIVYTAMVYSATLVFLTEPIIPKIVDVLLRNGTEPGKFPHPMDYYHLDVQKYYFCIITYSYVCEFMCVMVSVATDVMLITHIQHVCGIFAALGQKLQRTGTNDTSLMKGEAAYEPDKRDKKHLVSCIDRHNDALNYAHLIEATYTWIFLFITGVGVVLVIFLGLQILQSKILKINKKNVRSVLSLITILSRTSSPETTSRFVVLAVCLEFIFYVECYICQTLLNHSVSIAFYIQNSQWYKLSPKVQSLLQLMTMRCTVPCHLTAGKMFTVSLRSFGMTFKTTMSYFTLVRSIQEL